MKGEEKDELPIFSGAVRSGCCDPHYRRNVAARYISVRTGHRLGGRTPVIICGHRLFNETSKKQIIEKQDVLSLSRRTSCFFRLMLFDDNLTNRLATFDETVGFF